MSTTYDLINRLAELPLEPFEVAGTLDRSDRGPFLTIRPHKSPAAVGPSSGLASIIRALPKDSLT